MLDESISRRDALLAMGAVSPASLLAGLGTDYPDSLVSGILDVSRFGTKGDGKTDDTDAIQKAIDGLPKDGGVVYFPPGRFATRGVRCASHTTLLGFASWSYGKDGSTVLTPATEDQPCLLDCRQCVGTRIPGAQPQRTEEGKGHARNPFQVPE